MEQLSSLVEYGFRRAFITLIAIFCILLSVMNITVANPAFFDITANLGSSLDQVTWVMTAYVLGKIMIMPVSSWLSTQLGRRNYVVISIIVFTVSSFFCGNATDIRELIIFRLLQGLGGGGMLVWSHTIITESWPAKKRATSQALVILGMIAGRLLAQPFGGNISDNYSWPYIFFANIPSGIIAATLVLILVRNGSYEKREDWISNLMLVVGASSLYVGLERRSYENGALTPFMLDLLLLGLTGIILFVWRQRRLASSLGRGGVLENIHLRRGLALSLLIDFGGAASSLAVMSPLSKQAAQVSVNLLWIVISVSMVMLLLITVLIEKANGLKYTITAGLLLLAISCYMSYRIESVDVFWLLLIRGVAVTFLSLSVSTLVCSTLEGRQIGEGIALYSIVAQLSGVIGMSVFLC